MTLQVAELWRFPVKSVGGERIDEAMLTAVGLEGDRAFGLRDLDSGLILTARREPQLLMATARATTDRPVITLPDGTETDDDGALSSWLERNVALAPATAEAGGTFEIQPEWETETGDWVQWTGAAGSFHDSTKSHVSLVARSTMRDWDVRRFRTNIIIEPAPGSDPGSDDDLVGHRVAIGGAELDVKKQIDRCVMVTRPQPGGIERDLSVLRTINSERATFLGIGALVSQPGPVTIGDALTTL